RRSGPDAEPDELPSQSVLFDSRSQACLSEHAALNLEVPAIEVAASEDTETFRSQRRLDRLKPLARRPPLLAPDGEGARPGKRESERSAPPPGSEPRGKATVQARQRLEQMQERRQRAHAERAQRRRRSAGKGSLRGPQATLEKGHAHDQGKKGNRKHQRVPQHPETG